jgi:MFS transporter, DHA3 family, macrolide efflux protein
MLIALLPQIVLGPFIGPFIDRWNRKRIMIIADLLVSFFTVGLVVLFWSGQIQVWHIYVALLARSIAGSFQWPALQASIPLIVLEKQLARAAGLGQMLNGIISIAAPPAGALLLSVLPMQGVLAIDIGTALVAVSCLVVIMIPQPERTTLRGTALSPMSDMVAGFRYIWSWRGLMILGALGALINFFLIPVFSLLPIFVTKNLGGDVLRLGWLESAFGVGIIAGGLILGIWGGFKRGILTIFLGLVIASVSVIGLGFTTVGLFIMGTVFCFLIGAGLSMSNGPVMAMMQKIVAKDMQGRVFSLLGSITAAMSPLGLAITGPVADAIGIGPLYIIAGAATLLVVVSGLFMPDVMNLDKQTASSRA